MVTFWSKALCLFAACLLIAGEALAQAVGEIPGKDRAQAIERFKRASKAQREAIEEAGRRKMEQKGKKLTIREAEDARKKAEEEEQKAAAKKKEEERKKAEQEGRRHYDESFVKPLPGQRSIGAPLNRPGDKPTAYHVDVGPSGAAWTAKTPLTPAPRLPIVKRGVLPMEANQTLLLIKSGGPFPFPAKDGSVFGNREKALPTRPRGYYREYTVITPGLPDRGARRLVVGSGGEIYYTDNHYRSFRQVVN